MSYSAIDPTMLPPLSRVIVPEPEEFIAKMKAFLLEASPELEDTLDLESEPLVKLIETFAYFMMLDRADRNDDARAVLLASAQGGDLDQLAALVNVARLEGESDDAFRLRIPLALESFSGAVTKGYLEFFARASHDHVKDVSVQRPTPGNVSVTVLSTQGNGVPSGVVMSAVDAAVNDEDVRRIGEVITVGPAELVTFDVTAELQLIASANPDEVLADAQASLETFLATSHKLGGKVAVSAIFAALHINGVSAVSLTGPLEDVTATPAQAPFCSAINLTVSA